MSRVGKKIKKLAAVVLSLAVLVPAVVVGTSFTARANGPTGAGLAAHAMSAYNEGWVYSYGSAVPGAVDCSGLIYSYYGVGGIRSDMKALSPQVGSISTMPDIPGIGLYSPGHVGVYVGGGMAVDARDYGYDVCYQSVSSYPWTQWFYVYGVDYSGSAAPAEPSTEAESAGPAEPVPAPESVQNAVSQLYESQAAQSAAGQTQAPAEPEEPSYPDVGDSGSEVTDLQVRLQELAFFNDTPTGYFGEYTAECLRAFQAAAGLETTGVFDPDTEYVLYSEDAPSNRPAEYEGGEFAEEIHNIQQRLIQLQYMTGETTGFYGDITKAAVSTFQSVVGVEPTGIYDNTTRSMLEASNAPSNPAAAVIQKGDSGEEVTELQKRLILLRYMIGEPTGDFDDATEAAVKEFQTVNGMESTGIVDKDMKDVLYSDHAMRSPEADNLKVGFTGDDVKALQLKLKKLNLFTGESTGIFDTETEQAVKDFEDQNGLRVTGVASMSVRIVIDAVINSQNLGPTYARGTGAVVQAQAQIPVAPVVVDVTEGEASGTTTAVVLAVLFGSMVLLGAVVVFYVKRNPYVVRLIRVKLWHLMDAK